MKIPLPNEVKALARAFEHKALFAVGGLVRNSLLGYPPSDYDVCTPATPEETMAIGAQAGIRTIDKASAFGTVEFVINGAHMECTTFRKDVYFADGSHRPARVEFSRDMRDDAFRRDFTVNAIYANAATGEIIDPANGLADLHDRLIRATSPDPEIILRDDGLRVLRLVRFACELGYDIEPATFAAAKKYAHGLADIPAERIFPELTKILLSDARYHAPQPDGRHAALRGLTLLEELGALAYILPELRQGIGMAQKAQYHAYDVFGHSLHTAAECPPTATLRWAGLLHDIAKPHCLHTTGRMRGHDGKGEEMAREILLRLKAPKAFAERVGRLVRWHMYDLDGKAKTATLRKQIQQFGPEFTRELCCLREADFIGSGMGATAESTAGRWRAILAQMQTEGVPFSMGDMAITGADIKALGFDGPQIGRVKEALFAHLANHPKDNHSKRLKALAPRFR